ncbi:MAG: pyruvate, phosphate dikinase/phosphoenolpyruvate synthase regulator [candidate division Zixibacteria bacterium]|nr:pyruvate, phosphate dikinase/phosphoenolpyruvate synthase regulator [candidate division Zixibacteria bacterium]
MGQRMDDEVKKIVIVSDGTGKTARRLMDAVLAQYSDHVLFSVVDTFQQVRTKERVDSILKRIDDRYLVIFSIISDDLRNYFHGLLEDRDILHLNVLEPMLETMSKFLGVNPEYKPGLLQIIDDRYYRRIDAIGYTVEHDDGRGYRTEEAELVLVGLSRSCKTPISMYIACNFGMKVVNIPIVPNERMKEQLLRRLSVVDSKIIFGMLMQPDELARAREERAQLLFPDDHGKGELHEYHDVREIRNELRFVRKLYTDENWKSIDVTKRAIEEIAEEILRELKLTDFKFGDMP